MFVKLRVLTENTAGSGFLAEHGLSYLIEAGGEQILFDAGASNVFLENAFRMGLDIVEEIKTVVLSHGHWDHGNGLKHLSNRGKKLITHPLSFMSRYRKINGAPLGLAFGREEAERHFELNLSDKPVEVAPGVVFLGEVPRISAFEAQSTPFVDGEGQPDFVPDDSALAIDQQGQLIIVTGCSHAGICNIIEYAKKITRIEKIKAVVGGFHLKHADNNTLATIAYFKQNGIRLVYPSHCTELPALAEFQRQLGSVQVKTGMTLNFT